MWSIDFTTGCISRMDDNDQIITHCQNDPEMPFIIGIEPGDYAAERNYQDELKKSCF